MEENLHLEETETTQVNDVIDNEVSENKTEVNIIEEANTENVLIFHKEKSENKLIKILKSISYSVIPFLIFLVVQELAWTGNMLISDGTGLKPAIWLDSQIPLVSQFIWVYLLTFPIAIFAYFLAAYKDKKHFWNLWLTLMISFAISGVIYFFWQTEMVKPDLNPVTLSDKLLLWTWAACKPVNCLPSQHCFMAIGMFLAVYNQKKTTPAWLRWGIIVVSFLIVLATVFLKQHYVLDVLASFVIMVPTYLITKYCKFGEFMVRKTEQRKLKKQKTETL